MTCIWAFYSLIDDCDDASAASAPFTLSPTALSSQNESLAMAMMGKVI
jgi:hypothetical protein